MHRQGDPNTVGAVIISTNQSTVFANGILISVNDSPVAGHGLPPHASPFTANGSSTVFAEGIPVNRQGDSDTCGHSRASGSPNVNVGG